MILVGVTRFAIERQDGSIETIFISKDSVDLNVDPKMFKCEKLTTGDQMKEQFNFYEK